MDGFLFRTDSQYSSLDFDANPEYAPAWFMPQFAG